MNDCDRIRKRLDRLAAGEPAGEIEDAMKRHLERCPDCRRSLDGTEKIPRGAGEVRGDIVAALHHLLSELQRSHEGELQPQE